MIGRITLSEGIEPSQVIGNPIMSKAISLVAFTVLFFVFCFTALANGACVLARESEGFQRRLGAVERHLDFHG